MRAKIKITVLKKFSSKDVLGHYFKFPSGTEMKDCTIVEVGQEFIVEDELTMPEGFCRWAWVDIYRDVAILTMGGDFDGTTGLKYSACSDGLKPVVFKLDRIEE
ncbi:MAG: TIGR04076 family protein [Candidatus Heimdallarchaeota archaeon]|nr:TIGR04076 family protein [Candidatus Heimdallarchaeota archaeon]MBY8994433.1 TIGR04076 family protein [Candidatus Heimdallarchaeota archaeon]